MARHEAYIYSLLLSWHPVWVSMPFLVVFLLPYKYAGPMAFTWGFLYESN